MTNKRTGKGNVDGSEWGGRLFLFDAAGGDVGVFGGGWVDVAEVVLGGVGLDSRVTGAGGCRIVAAWAGWLGACRLTGVLLLDGGVGVRMLLLVQGLRRH